jgi:hypothetical protein
MGTRTSGWIRPGIRTRLEFGNGSLLCKSKESGLAIIKDRLQRTMARAKPADRTTSGRRAHQDSGVHEFSKPGGHIPSPALSGSGSEGLPRSRTELSAFVVRSYGHLVGSPFHLINTVASAAGQAEGAEDKLAKSRSRCSPQCRPRGLTQHLPSPRGAWPGRQIKVLFLRRDELRADELRQVFNRHRARFQDSFVIPPETELSAQLAFYLLA